MSRRHRVEQSVYSHCDAREAGRRIIISPVASHGRRGNLSLSARVPAGSLIHGEQNRIGSSLERMDISATAVQQRLIPALALLRASSRRCRGDMGRVSIRSERRCRSRCDNSANSKKPHACAPGFLAFAHSVCGHLSAVTKGGQSTVGSTARRRESSVERNHPECCCLCRPDRGPPPAG